MVLTLQHRKESRLSMEPFVKFEHVKKVYHMGEITIEALRDASFEIEKGEICVIVGPSGAGKTTLLNILGGMDTLSEGRVFLDGKEISKYNARELTTYRRYEIGFVFQFYNLIQNLTALENVSLAAGYWWRRITRSTRRSSVVSWTSTE